MTKNKNKKITIKLLRGAIKEMLREQTVGDTTMFKDPPGKDPNLYNPNAGDNTNTITVLDKDKDEDKAFAGMAQQPTQAIWKVVGIDPDGVTIAMQGQEQNFPADFCGNWERSGTIRPRPKEKEISRISELGIKNPKLSKSLKESLIKSLKNKK